MGITRQDPSLGKDTPVFGQKSDRATLIEMLQGYTLNNAKQMNLENETGSIEVGKSADFMVIPKNIFNIDVYEIKDINPEEVYFKGKKLK